mmetsp:Transcript_15396/g.47879  ORF Transcript_15396/g.47879 Transcript_15396/m.47879 type:complete len:215 (+) Transcript_15396:333-977(+)
METKNSGRMRSRLMCILLAPRGSFYTCMPLSLQHDRRALADKFAQHVHAEARVARRGSRDIEGEAHHVRAHHWRQVVLLGVCQLQRTLHASHQRMLQRVLPLRPCRAVGKFALQPRAHDGQWELPLLPVDLLLALLEPHLLDAPLIEAHAHLEARHGRGSLPLRAAANACGAHAAARQLGHGAFEGLAALGDALLHQPLRGRVATRRVRHVEEV